MLILIKNGSSFNGMKSAGITQPLRLFCYSCSYLKINIWIFAPKWHKSKVSDCLQNGVILIKQISGKKCNVGQFWFFLRENETFMLFSNSVGVWKWLTLTINFPPHQIPFIYPTSSSCFRARKVSFSSTYPRKWVYPFPVRTCYWKIILVYFRRIGGSLFLLFFTAV